MTLEHNPYAAPTAGTGIIQSGNATLLQPLRPLGGLGAAAIFTIAGVIVIRLLGLAMDYHIVATVEAIQNGTLERTREVQESIQSDVALLRTGLVAAAILFLVSGIITLTWIHRAHSNLPALGNQYLQYTPGWCVAYWFIPIVSLFRPYQAMCELMNGSDPDRYSADAAPIPPQSANVLLGFWWLFWILMILVGNVSSHVTESEDVHFLFGLDVAYVLFTTVSGLLTITVIRRIQAFQERRRELISETETAGDSPFQAGPAW